MTGHKPPHDTGRSPLRLRPLPRPSRPADQGADAAPNDEAAADAEASEPAPEEAEVSDVAPAAESASEVASPGERAEGEGDDEVSEYSRGEWIHEWEQPEG
ncbi:MAG: hypothetical protein AAF721_16440 [Myxococcota bacterium]